MCLAGPAIGHQESDELAFRLPEVGYLFQANFGAVQARMPTRVIEPGDVPTPFRAVIEEENLAQEFAHAPEIVFSLVGAE